MPETVRANAVEVARVFQARCRLDGCDWAGKPAGAYQEANAERQAHLEEHRRQAAAGEVPGA